MKDIAPQSGAYQFWEPWREKGEAGAIPVFRFPEKNAGGVLTKLPDPGTAFGLDFHCGYHAGVTLKELAKLKNLKSLCIGGVQGKAYADLKDLAGMTSLRGLYLFYFERVVPRVGRFISRHRTAYNWLPESTRMFPPPTELARRMSAAGFEGVGYRTFLPGVTALHVGTRAG